MKRILVVDDNKTNLAAAKTALSDCYGIAAVTSGELALKFLETNTCDLILLDIHMPGMDGFEVFDKINHQQQSNGKEVPPVIFLTGETSPETENRCLEAGAQDFIAKPFVLSVMRTRIARVLELEDLRKDLEEKLEQRTQHVNHIRDMMTLGMASMVESRDSSTGGHIKRTSEVVRIFAKKLVENGFSPEYLGKVVRAAPMHDLGKIAVMDAVLCKQGKFTDEEYALMKKHSAEGARIVKQILDGIEEEGFVKIATNIAHFHHEKWNGKGYPDGIAGENIPVESRIMALADVFDALVSKRCYKESFSFDKSFSIIENDLGSHFDPILGRIFIACRKELEEYYNSVKD